MIDFEVWPNENSFLIDARLRQLDVVDSEKLELPITVIGGGAIGSFTTLALAKLGCSNLEVWDYDTIEIHNIANQLVPVDSIGKAKTEVLNQMILELAGIHLTQQKRKYNGEKIETGVLIVVPDNMRTRQLTFNHLKDNPYLVGFFIEARMALELATIYAFKPSNAIAVKDYEKRLPNDDDVDNLPCSARSIIYCPLIIGGIIARLVKGFVMDEEVPFKVLFDMNNMHLEWRKANESNK